MPKCRIHNISWRDDLERGEYFSCPECDRIREEEHEEDEDPSEEEDDDEDSED